MYLIPSKSIKLHPQKNEIHLKETLIVDTYPDPSIPLSPCFTTTLNKKPTLQTQTLIINPWSTHETENVGKYTGSELILYNALCNIHIYTCHFIHPFVPILM